MRVLSKVHSDSRVGNRGIQFPNRDSDINIKCRQIGIRSEFEDPTYPVYFGKQRELTGFHPRPNITAGQGVVS
jgi:hypothetical protein